VPEGLLRIGELSRRTGLSRDLIRAWERRYDLLSPTRTQGNIRLYSVDDISRLRLMQHYLAKGIPAAQSAGLVHQVQTAAHDSNPGLPPGDVRAAHRVLRDSLEGFDDAAAARVLERLLGVFAPGAILRDVILPYLRDLGQRWECGRVSVGQEHFASNFLEAWMLSMARGWGAAGSRRAVVACVPGERHTLGLIAFGLALRDLGWRVAYLGADAPLRGVEQAATTLRADAVVLACTLPETFAAAGDEIREHAGRLPLALGGAGVGESRGGWLATRTLPADPLVAAQALTAVVPPAPGPAAAQPVPS
jgi:DNA-binding transcriptional MerR regulator